MLAERTQTDFELAFFAAVLEKLPDFADVLRAHALNLAVKGLVKEGLMADQKLVQLRPEDPDAHYSLACRYAVLKQPDLALRTLRRAVELGYRDFRTMIQDRHLESVRKDPRFRAILREYHG
jgi:Flp pilus assembly protein TadD